MVHHYKAQESGTAGELSTGRHEIYKCCSDKKMSAICPVDEASGNPWTIQLTTLPRSCLFKMMKSIKESSKLVGLGLSVSDEIVTIVSF